VDVVSVGHVDWLDECPAYRCTGRLRRRAGGDGIEAQVELYGEGDESTHRLDVSDAPAIVDHWLDQAEQSSTLKVVLDATDGIGLDPGHDLQTAHRTSPVEWTFALGVDEARRLADNGRSLNHGGALEVTSSDGTTKTAIRVRFSPADPAAVAVFAGEHMVDRLEDLGDAVTPAAVTELAATTSVAFGLHAEALRGHDLRERLWRRGRQDVVYRLRAAEDFAYA
jgi:hypothetical protein